MRFRKEPDYVHGAASRTAVVLANLGTPEAPTTGAVRRYLKQFLSDPRVVEIPGPLWWFILNGLILPLRSRKSAEKYASIWTAEGSPLKVYTDRQATLLRNSLRERGHVVEVAYAMRYGTPSLPAVLDALRSRGCERFVVLPAYPQYSGTTTASLSDEVYRHLSRLRNVPELRLVKHYHDHAGYIDALKQLVLAYWQAHGRPDRLVMSFHGVPKRTLSLGDPYHCECQKTARLLTTVLGLDPGQVLVTFQSRFGKAEWLQPYTAPSLAKLAREGVRRVDVICPGFTSDCLETLEEIAMEGRAAFLTAGGKEFHYIPCLNGAPAWIAALTDIAESQLCGWPTTKEALEREAAEAEISRVRAQSLGATNL